MKKIVPGTPCKTSTPLLTGMQFCVIALFACQLLLPAPALAATVDYSSGSFDYLFGNPVNAGDSTGIGGTNSRVRSQRDTSR
ncbi:MAG: hypothetical protein LBB60_00105 [Desulfovibrio sp.]|jgi:hypothetical protein|nr:hypothetical protein [Desulfovibrio sp.]